MRLKCPVRPLNVQCGINVAEIMKNVSFSLKVVNYSRHHAVTYIIGATRYIVQQQHSESASFDDTPLSRYQLRQYGRAEGFADREKHFAAVNEWICGFDSVVNVLCLSDPLSANPTQMRLRNTRK